MFHWKRDTAGAEALCKDALEIDPMCDGAFAALGQMYLQMHDYEKAVTAFRQLLDVSTNMGQIALALYHSYVSQSQSTFQYYGTDACPTIVDGSTCQGNEGLSYTRCSAAMRLWTLMLSTLSGACWIYAIAHYAFIHLASHLLHQPLLLQSCLYPINDLYETCHLTVINPRSCNGEVEAAFRIQLCRLSDDARRVELDFKINSTISTTLLRQGQ